MSGFYVLDVPEFAPLIEVALKTPGSRAHALKRGYRFVEFNGGVEIRRADTGLNEAIWYGCLTAGLVGKIARFDSEILKLVDTNEPVLSS